MVIYRTAAQHAAVPEGLDSVLVPWLAHLRAAVAEQRSAKKARHALQDTTRTYSRHHPRRK